MMLARENVDTAELLAGGYRGHEEQAMVSRRKRAAEATVREKVTGFANRADDVGGQQRINHSIFWKNLSPNGGGEPEGDLAEAIKDSFGSFDAFKAQFTAAALGIQGSGWAVLAHDTVSGRLVTFQMFDQQGNVPVGTIPLFQVDMWEHAFYLDYLNVKADYVKAIWNIANWQDAGERLAAAASRTPGLIVR